MQTRILLPLILLLSVAPFRAVCAERSVSPLPASDSTATSAKEPVLHPEAAAPSSLVRKPGEMFRAQQLIVPGALLGTGVFGVVSPWYMDKVNVPVHAFACELSGGRNLHFDDYIQYIPIAAFLGLGFAMPSGHDFIERTCITATCYATMGLLVNAAKYTIREPRPDNAARNAFPSGHTATAFMGAELLRKEYGPWWGAGAYAIATVTGLMRVYNDRHWTNDVIGGAAIGILSADIAYWLLPLERRLLSGLGKDVALRSGRDTRSTRSAGRSPATVALLPTPYGISFSCVF